MAPARRRRCLVGTPRPFAPLVPVNPADLVEHADPNVGEPNVADANVAKPNVADVAVDVAVNHVEPATPTEQNTDNLDESNNQPCPIG